MFKKILFCFTFSSLIFSLPTFADQCTDLVNTNWTGHLTDTRTNKPVKANMSISTVSLVQSGSDYNLYNLNGMLGGKSFDSTSHCIANKTQSGYLTELAAQTPDMYIESRYQAPNGSFGLSDGTYKGDVTLGYFSKN